ncbi:hypothetical protein RUM43_000553 [Polyplax serrata]|uniref:Uncharacterized protein n=1 Tax=Polyplax serrata TaxID=468196 RepID=A0AAN8SE45_POLSC
MESFHLAKPNRNPLLISVRIGLPNPAYLLPEFLTDNPKGSVILKRPTPEECEYIKFFSGLRWKGFSQETPRGTRVKCRLFDLAPSKVRWQKSRKILRLKLNKKR